ncbi:aquaporin-9-like [Gigantopelta aegis]|uniref:aquaporin-9-like n=1 Tax=Gigantopelta aegis TaxID=1735272 RepID=UPI001B88AAB4|nr:aquaporin-9-like [Gigantopelta aegis]
MEKPLASSGGRALTEHFDWFLRIFSQPSDRPRTFGIQNVRPTFAVGSGAQYILSRQELSSYFTINAAGGMGLTLGIYWAGGVSGGYLNPCVAFVFCLRGNTAWWKLLYYAVAEFVGAFVAAAVQFGVYYDAINYYDGGVRMTEGPNATAGIFSTFPNPNVSTLNCFFDQVFGTFILIGCILAITDRKNMLPDKGLLPLALGGIVFAIGTCWALNCGYAINPCRDFGPRLFTVVAGWGLEPLSFRNYNWFWVPIVGPVCGTLLGWLVYWLFVELHWEPDDIDDANAILHDDKQITMCQQNGTPNSMKKFGINNDAFISENLPDPVSDESTKL